MNNYPAAEQATACSVLIGIVLGTILGAAAIFWLERLIALSCK